MNNPSIKEACRQENIDLEVLAFQERLIFDAMSLVEYRRHREKRGLPPLTHWQEDQLLLERIAAALFKLDDD